MTKSRDFASPKKLLCIYLSISAFFILYGVGVYLGKAGQNRLAEDYAQVCIDVHKGLVSGNNPPRSSDALNKLVKDYVEKRDHYNEWFGTGKNVEYWGEIKMKTIDRCHSALKKTIKPRAST